MKPYAPKKLRPLRLLSELLRGLASLLDLWPLLLLVALLLSPVSPHLRWTYTYEQHGNQRYYHACTYLGVRGLVPFPVVYGDCPVILMINQGSLL